jgi:U4/U6 small nuclear ribonucleoprotein PRP3
MLRRVKWTEQARPRGGEAVEVEKANSDEEGDNEAGGDASAGVGKGKAVDGGQGDEEGIENESLEDNKCWLIWEGTLRERTFTGFKARSCPTEREVKEVLGDMKGYWDMAKNWKGEEEELY